MYRTSIILLKVILIAMAMGIAIAGYTIYYYSRNLPDYSQLKAYHPPCVTRIYSSDGKLMEEYAREHRIFVPISSLPKSLIEAFIAVEDKNYYDHSGIDIFSILRAAIKNIPKLLNNQRVEGGSTITQQVVKNFLLTSERKIERKIKEAILSYMITKTLTKDQILELYLNQIYLGKGAYGVAAAALVYFNKSVEELTLNESAVLAAMPKSPSQFDPRRHYNRIFERKNYVIMRMYEEGYIPQKLAKETIKDPIILGTFNKQLFVNADYYAEQVRSEVINMFGEEYFYTAGLTIITCLDSTLQKGAAKALDAGILKFDRDRGYRGPIKNIDIINWQDDLKEMPIPAGIKNDFLAVVLEVHDNFARIGLKDATQSNIYLKDMKWAKTNLKSVKDILKVGDIIIACKKHDSSITSDKNSNLQYMLGQIPLINGGMIVMEPVTGKVLAAEGGYDFGASKFNRVNQASRQSGSLIKPFVYLAALENGIEPNRIFEDEYLEISQGPSLPLWTPKNHDSKFMGPITMRKGMEKSRNLVTIRVGLTAGIKKVAETIRRFGISEDPVAMNSIFLGAVDTSLEKMTTAYAIIASEGRKVVPHYIELIKDRKGNVLYRRDYSECDQCKNYKFDQASGNVLPPEYEQADERMITDEASNYQITSFLEGVMKRGTGSRAKGLSFTVAGKTGTTNNAKDVWFIGFTPRLVVGNFIGYDQPKSLGAHAYGANVTLPIFIDFMKNSYQDIPDIPFRVPSTIKLVKTSYDNGQVSTAPDSIDEAFKVNNYLPNIEYDNDNQNLNLDDTSNEVY